MKNRIQEDESIREGRNLRCLLSYCIIGITLPLYADGAFQNREATIGAAILFVVFILGCGLLQASIANQLFKQHRGQELKLNILAMFMIMTLFALPFGASTALQTIYETVKPNITPDRLVEIRNRSLFLEFFLMFPVFFVTEDLLNTWANRSKSRKAVKLSQREKRI